MLVSGINAQRFLTHSVISAFGMESTTANYEQVSHTVGELMTETFTGVSASWILTQGFHQDNGIVTDIQKLDMTVSLYPNPTKDYVYLNFTASDVKIYRIELYDISGKLVLSDAMDSRFENKMDLSELKRGIYLLKISSVTGKYLITHKLEKVE